MHQIVEVLTDALRLALFQPPPANGNPPARHRWPEPARRTRAGY